LECFWTRPSPFRVRLRSHRVSSGKPLSRRAILLLLAAWMAVWPATEAATSVARLAALTASRTKATRPCGMRAEAGGSGRDCCRESESSDARSPLCPEGGAARCSQCFSMGGLVLFAHGPALPDPECVDLGAIRSGNLAATSRAPRPPVPPPRSDHPIFV
jgi:hypothetical protein